MQKCTYIVPISELRKSIYYACEETFCDNDVREIMFNQICGIVEDYVTEHCSHFAHIITRKQ